MIRSHLLPACLGVAVLTGACAPRDETTGGSTASAAPQPADTVIRDTAIYTLDPEQPWAEALAIREGDIVFVGNDTDVEAYIGPHTKVLSQPDGMVLPGFQDAHVHPLTSGIDHLNCRLDELPESPQAYATRIAACAEDQADRAWVTGDGWYVSAFAPDGLPRKELLDQVVPDKPAMFYSIDGHSAWVNSRALELAGITADTADPPGGRIDREPHSREPVGSLQETATNLVKAVVPPPPPEQIEAGLRWAIDTLHGFGITAMQEANATVRPDDPNRMLPTYRAFADTHELSMHTVVSLGWDNGKGLEQIHAIEAARERYDGGMLRVSTVKFYLDGVLEPSTAALLEDYSDQPGFRGDLLVPQDLLNEAVAQLDAKGFQVDMHVIGDAAVHAALDAFEFALERNGPTDNRHHLAHVELVDPADISRFAELNVTATFSALWAKEDNYLKDLTLPRVGPERYRWIYPIGSILTAGGRIAFGSDWNVDSPNPLLAIETAVTRVEPRDESTPVFMPQEAITLEDALAAATLNAAYVNHLDDHTGSIAVRKRADLVVLDTNLFEIEPREISNARVVTTLFGGEAVYTRSD